MVAHHALVRAAVRRQVLAGREDREERRLHPRDPRAQPRRLRAARAVGLRAEAVAVEEVGLPAVVGRSSSPGRPRCPGSSAGAPGPRARASSSARILPPVGLEAGRPQERVVVEERLVADQRGAAEPALERRQRLLAEGHGQVDDPFAQSCAIAGIAMWACISPAVGGAAARRPRGRRGAGGARPRAPASRSSLRPTSRNTSETTAIAPSETRAIAIASPVMPPISGADDRAEHDQRGGAAEREQARVRGAHPPPAYARPAPR